MMKFSMNGLLQIEEDTTVMENFGRRVPFQILNDFDNVSEIFYEDLVWVKNLS